MKVLVAYMSKTGNTRKVAEAISGYLYQIFLPFVFGQSGSFNGFLPKWLTF